MKRFIFLLASFCLVATASLQAQNNSFYLSANAGANLSKFKMTEDLQELYPYSNAVFGLNTGVGLGFEVENFTVATGVNYIQKGSEYQTDNFSDANGTGFFSATEKLHYITIPITVGYRLYLGDQFALSIAAGPSFNMGLTGKIDDEVAYFGNDQVEKQNYKVAFGRGLNEDYRPVQMSFLVSPGLVFQINTDSKLTFNVAFETDTKDAFNPRYKDANDFFSDFRGDQFNTSTVFTLGYEYHFSFGDRY